MLLIRWTELLELCLHAIRCLWGSIEELLLYSYLLWSVGRKSPLSTLEIYTFTLPWQSSIPVKHWMEVLDLSMMTSRSPPNRKACFGVGIYWGFVHVAKLICSCQNEKTGKTPEAESMYLQATAGKDFFERIRKIVIMYSTIHQKYPHQNRAFWIPI